MPDKPLLAFAANDLRGDRGFAPRDHSASPECTDDDNLLRQTLPCIALAVMNLRRVRGEPARVTVASWPDGTGSNRLDL